ncbi:hypothetical protein HPB49_000377 [Dermacentor silvarum]|uniref:Uncharacterized protein n=1 Tax=Dermacentor silvarum TaxID=543639 RepID=A0ACB8DS30_DERSI|nr:hypothetical protein HPB49_000377 [Dermacentor silvarum]
MSEIHNERLLEVIDEVKEPVEARRHRDGNRKDQWLRAIPRKDFTPSVNSKVCELHFQTSDFITMLTHCDEITGRTLEVDSDRVRLKADAVPPVFLNWLTYNHNACSARVSGLQASKD